MVIYPFATFAEMWIEMITVHVHWLATQNSKYCADVAAPPQRNGMTMLMALLR